MARKLVYSGLVAGLLCGCQSAKHSTCCDDCVPPKPTCGKYNSLTDNLVTKLTASQCAKSDLKELRKSCGKMSGDFEDGFHQAYIDLAMGRLAQTPPVPPRKYWSAYYRSCAGTTAVADWFEGYRAGLESGGRGEVSRFHQVATSWGHGAEGPQAVYAADQHGWQGGTPAPGPAPLPAMYPPPGGYLPPGGYPPPGGLPPGATGFLGGAANYPLGNHTPR